VTSAGAHATLPGDFNGDNVVNAGDYVAWRKTDGTPGGYNTWRANFGESAAGPSLPGDYNANGAVDAADYIVWRMNDGTQAGHNNWRANFGATAAGAAAVAHPASGRAVPEPASAALLLYAAVGLLAVPRRRVAAKNRCRNRSADVLWSSVPQCARSLETSR
jgi:hypothetical protein